MASRMLAWAAGALLLVVAALPAVAGWDEGKAAYDRRDWAGAIRELQPLAAGGHAGAQARVGHMTLFGYGTPRDEAAAVAMLKAAAAAEEPLAQLWLANALMNGQGGPRDPAQAVGWLQRAAAQGLPQALHNLGELYFNGVAVPKDEAKGLDYYSRAVQTGYMYSADPLAQAHWAGRGTPVDRVQAVRYGRMAADAGWPRAQALLAIALWTGDGVAQDRAAAITWFRRAAERGHVASQHNLALAYGAGNSVARDLAQAYFWLVIAANGAADKDRVTYERERDQAAARLPADEAARIRTLAQAWQPLAPGTPAPVAASLPSLSTLPGAAQPKTGGGHGYGSGFVVARDGIVLTNAHVVQGCRRIRVQPADASWHDVATTRLNPADDLALLWTDLRLPEVARFRNDRPLRSGDEVVVVGYPLSTILSREANVTAGVISAQAGLRGDARYYQLTAPVQKGNSGGPLADGSANVVGIVTSKLDAMTMAGKTGDIPQNVNFAVKDGVARKFMQAEGVTPLLATSAETLSVADVGDRIRKVTVFVDCEK